MALQSARFSGDPVLGRCLAGSHRMFAPEENLSVMRVQEALRRLDFDPGGLDGIFGAATGAAVSSFKEAHGLSPSDPVVGVGTSGKLDSLLLHNPPHLDPDFGEVAGFVAAHVVEPFMGFALARRGFVGGSSARRRLVPRRSARARRSACPGDPRG